MIPVFLAYVLSFVFVGIYWNNHHHMLHAVQHVNGAGLWGNLHLLFWLSLIPFVTGWMSENHFAPLPVAIYGAVLFMSGAAYFIFERTLIRFHGANSDLSRALGAEVREIVSVLIYAMAIPLAFWQPLVSCALYVLVAIMWVAPDPRIERLVAK